MLVNNSCSKFSYYIQPEQQANSTKDKVKYMYKGKNFIIQPIRIEFENHALELHITCSFWDVGQFSVQATTENLASMLAVVGVV